MSAEQTSHPREQQGTAETTDVVAEICTDEKGNVLWVERYIFKRKEAVGATFTRDRKTYQVLHSAVTFGKHRGALVEHVVRKI